MRCERCGTANAAGARFCRSCGEPLPGAAGAVERKIVSALFCDVAGFTQRASTLDPEDVHRLVRPYAARARAELERFGGTVEKFIGDAVFALFGAPRAHGDDPERAVRAALAIRDSIAELNEADAELDLHLRLAVATGEVLVELGARPSEGEGMAWGDLLNTASRLQAAAPVDSVLVDEASYRATRHVIDYGVAEPVVAKGKAEPILVWEALSPRSRRGIDLSQGPEEPLVGRMEELALLAGTLERVQRTRIPELVTLVGEPGIGKSRLLFELFRRLEQGTELVSWRQGRSSPYGEGFTYWALAEVVKGEAGILETDSAGAAREKLAGSVNDLVADAADAARIETHLRSLLAFEDAAGGQGAEREAAFAAWRHFLEALARQRPLLLVFDDIHWADDGLLDFIEHLLEWARDVRLLILCTTRPELIARRPNWGEAENAATLHLSSLSADETRELVGTLSARPLPASLSAAIVRAAAGNALYAVEFVRMLEDRGLLDGPDAGLDLPVPESVHGIIAARLDALPAKEKSLLHDASVVGRVFWPGVVATIAGRSRPSVERQLQKLERKEFLLRANPSSVAREPEYQFRHVLVRDVAYAQIPRWRRRIAHHQTAEWLESLSPDRARDRAEMLAHHYLSAYELARAAGADTGDLAERARVSVRDAGARALSLSAFPAAARYLRAALDLWPASDPDRPRLLLDLGKSLYHAATEGGDHLAEAERGLLAAGDPEAAAEAARLLASLANQRGESQERVFEHANRAMSLVEGRRPSRARVDVLLDFATFLVLAAEHHRAIDLATEALRDAEALELRELEALALATLGFLRGISGDPAGRAALVRAVEITEEIGSPLGSHCCGVLADLDISVGNLQEGFSFQARAREHATRFGHASHVQWLKAELVAEHYWTGRWPEAIEAADEFIEETEHGSGHFMESYCRDMRGRIRLAMGDVPGALDDARRALDHARSLNQPQLLYPALAFRARTLAASAELDEAGVLAEELLALWSSKLDVVPSSAWVVDLAGALDLLGHGEDLDAVVGARSDLTMWAEAALAYCRGRFPTAAALYGRIGSRPDEAFARVRAAEVLAGRGRHDEARVQIERASRFYREVDATAYLHRAEGLLVDERSL